MRSLILALCVAICGASNSYEPMVAFVCDKGAMHMDPGKGWSNDPNTDCMESKQSILNYCKLAYPTLDVTNIVEASEHMTINGWCPLGQATCQIESFNVRPYRCLTGPFQSDALVVPKGCVFDHVHDAEQCQSFDWWANVAKASCSDLHHMNTESFAMLLPCKTDMFTGAEFVCCPKDGTVAAEETASEDTIIELPHIDVKVKVPDTTTSKTQLLGTDEMNGAVAKYMRMTAEQQYEGEHEVYELAKESLLKENHDKITKLMKEWAEAREQIHQTKLTDPKGAESLNEELTSRFQHRYFGLQTEGEQQVLQLDAIHQQHVQSNFNTKKRKAMESLMDELQAEFYDEEDILRYLKRYISVEQKDAAHCIRHFLKLRARDPLAASQMLPSTVEHLDLISLRINQSIDLLDTLSETVVANKLKTSARAWMSSAFASIDKTVEQISSLPQPAQTTTVREALFSLDAKSEDSSASSEENMYRKYAEKLSQTDFVKQSGVDIVPLYEEDESEDESYGNMALSDMITADEQNISSRSFSVGIGIAVACAAVGALLLASLAVILVKKRSRHSRPSHMYLEVAVDSQDLSPEDRHIVAMQNGYENPTYKLLEQR